MSIEALNDVLKYAKVKTSSQKLVLIYLANWVNQEKGNYAWPSIAKLANECCLSTRHVKRVLKDLEELGELRVERRGGRHIVSKYFILSGKKKKGDILSSKIKGDMVSEKVTPTTEKVPVSHPNTLDTLSDTLKDPTSPTAKSTPKEPKAKPKIPVKEKLSELEYAEPGSEFDSDKGGNSALAQFIGQEMHIALSNTNLSAIGMTYTEHTTKGKIVHPSPDELWNESEFFRDYVNERVKYFKDGSGTPAARRNRLIHLICNYKSEPFGWFAQKKEYEGFTGKWKDV